MQSTIHSTPPIGIPPFPVRRFSVEEYQRMAQAGVLTEDDRVELLEGWIVPKMTLNPRHDAAVELAADVLGSRLPAGWRIRIQSAVTTCDSEPEPDVVIVRGTARDHVMRHPSPPEIALLVEVADTSLERDRQKCRLYGLAGIAVYWIVNLSEAQVEVYTHPTGPSGAPAYSSRRVYRSDESIPLSVDQVDAQPVAVKDLLP